MSSITTRPVPPPCEHKVLTGCMLTALPCCCSCADQRPHADAYPTYVDGQGMRMRGKRWQRYCRKCHDHWESTNLETSITSPTSISTPSLSNDLPDMNSYNNLVSQSEPTETPGRQNAWVPGPPQSEEQQTSRARRRANRAFRRELTPTRLARRNFPLGTIEDVQREDYESPIAGMFGRAYTRFRDAEEAREAARQAGILPENGADNPFGVMHSDPRFNPFAHPPFTSAEPRTVIPIRSRASFHRQFYGSIFGRNPRITTISDSSNPSDNSHTDLVPHPSETDDFRNAIDRQRRAESRSSEELVVNFACKICLEQKINILCEPCMHAVMCQWCSQLYRQAARDENGRFVPSLWTCPVCRAPITQCRKFYLE